VSAPLEDLDEVRSDPTGGSRDGDPLAAGFGLHRFFLSQRRLGTGRIDLSLV
jgi:hypothetical protein